MSEFVATCWGGPLEGQTIAAPYTEFNAARFKPMRYDLMLSEPADPMNAVGYWTDTYRYERVMFGPLLFGAWVIQSPSERTEAIHETIIGGLTIVAWMCSPCGPVCGGKK